MKRFLAVTVLLLSFVPTSGLFAKEFGKARAGLLVGGTSSSARISDFDVKSISIFHAGLTAQLPMGMGFALQPSLLYQTKGMAIGDMKGLPGADIKDSFKTKVGYLELPVQIQWGPDLMLFRPYLFAEPFVGYQLGSKNSGGADTIKDRLHDLEYGLGLGGGIDLWILQVSAKYFWNFGNIYKSGSSAPETMKGLFKDGNNFNGFAVSVALFF